MLLLGLSILQLEVFLPLGSCEVTCFNACSNLFYACYCLQIASIVVFWTLVVCSPCAIFLLYLCFASLKFVRCFIFLSLQPTNTLFVFQLVRCFTSLSLQLTSTLFVIVCGSFCSFYLYWITDCIALYLSWRSTFTCSCGVFRHIVLLMRIMYIHSCLYIDPVVGFLILHSSFPIFWKCSQLMQPQN